MRARILDPDTRKWWTLGAVAFGLFMIMLDNTVVNVALPSIQRDLGTSLSGLEWTINAYTLTFGVLLVTAIYVLPAASARLLSGSVPTLIAWALALGLAEGVLGLYLAYWLDVPPGPPVALLGATTYLVLSVVSLR